MHFLDDSSVLSQDCQSKSIDLNGSGKDGPSFVLSQDGQSKSIDLDGLGEDGPSSSFQSTFFFVFTCF